MILTIGNTKGGTGKSTLAVNLAIHRAKTRSVLLVDGDEQQSALSFTQLRFKNDYTAVALTGQQIRLQVPNLVKHYKDIIIDVGGRDSGSLRAALTISDSLLIPVQPRTFDVWAMDVIASIVTDARVFNPKLRPYSVLSIADVQGNENESAATVIKEYETIEYLPTPIMRRKVYTDGLAQGKGVSEVKPRNSKAIAEFELLVSKLYSGATQ